MVVDSILHSFLRIDEPIAFNIAIVPENPMGAILHSPHFAYSIALFNRRESLQKEESQYLNDDDV
ncbi:hypothetical protein PRIPAC_74127 [Pristionchus pacificus]|uniref:Uncharacterized protein n=1 Tax=Pristionchus pacificus TaxID=54126 RepID=A0A2A6BFA5_PRIPA|nr:hypothetical protein PRIPAC_74127 [Pristionchus pacificus]|eukprot:PDM64595.1 hypothetical protein PRIPAC_52851 [Pristionchus pacificus]